MRLEPPDGEAARVMEQLRAPAPLRNDIVDQAGVLQDRGEHPVRVPLVTPLEMLQELPALDALIIPVGAVASLEAWP